MRPHERRTHDELRWAAELEREIARQNRVLAAACCETESACALFASAIAFVPRTAAPTARRYAMARA